MTNFQKKKRINTVVSIHSFHSIPSQFHTSSTVTHKCILEERERVKNDIESFNQKKTRRILIFHFGVREIETSSSEVHRTQKSNYRGLS